jgi:hypothetical protein
MDLNDWLNGDAVDLFFKPAVKGAKDTDFPFELNEPTKEDQAETQCQ